MKFAFTSVFIFQRYRAPYIRPNEMLHRKLRALAVVLLATLAIAPIDSNSQATRKKQTSSSTRRKAAKKPARKTTKKPVRRAAAAPAVPAVSATAPRSAAALSADMASMVARVRSGEFGVMAVSLTRGDTLFQHDAGTPLMPASTMKMLTSAAAFERLGPRYQFSTDVLYDGTLQDGTLNGNVYLRGDGDPSLSGRYLPGGPDAPMNFLADQLVSRGVKRITGTVIGDASAFDDQKIPEGWLTRYLQAGYAARVSGLSLNENLVWVTVTPGGGAKLEPATSAIPLINNVRTVAGSGASLSVRRQTDGAIVVSGRIGSRSLPRRYEYVVEDPPSFATGALRAALIAKGIQVDGGIRLGRTPSSAVKIASIQSPTLDRIISAMNRESINHFAELLMRNAARGPQRNEQGNVTNGQALLRQFFATKVKADTLHLEIFDGSGLSTLDRVTPRAMTQMLAYAHRADWGPWFHASLPVAGESELLKRRMRGGAAQGNLHAKTGTTNDVIGLGGYVTALNGEVIAFSFIYNGRDRWTAKSMIDTMGQTLANFAR